MGADFYRTYKEDVYEEDLDYPQIIDQRRASGF